MGHRLTRRSFPSRAALRAARRYILGNLLLEAVIAILYLTMSHRDFVALIRDIGPWVILLVFVYKEILTFIMAMTYDKSHLDRRYIWQQQAIACVALFGWMATEFTGFYQREFLLLSVVWFNVWVQMCWSMTEVLGCLWTDRLQYIYWHAKGYGVRPTLACLRSLMNGRYPVSGTPGQGETDDDAVAGIGRHDPGELRSAPDGDAALGRTERDPGGG